LVRLGISWVSDVIGAGSHVGYERLAELQEEILWLCEAAHLPVIWATQVLEQLAKSGLPSRAEISDAAMGERAECVMVNKGPAH
jgi:pyruvate kinase